MKSARSSVTGAEAMFDYRIRAATLDDVDVLVHHRLAMFTDMGLPMDVKAVGLAFKDWVTRMLRAGTFRAWVVETPSGDVVAGGGMTILPWPPGPLNLGDNLAFVYNVYTEPSHRRRGLARMVMEAIHAWCREAGITAAALNSSTEGQPLYESLGYSVRTNPMMVNSLKVRTGG
jgi:GNAT superfamily N-acetyltransferase